MVRVLRNQEPAEYAPQPGVADLERLAGGTPAGPRVEVTLSGDLGGLPAAVDAALFRIAREAVTNACGTVGTPRSLTSAPTGRRRRCT